ncbi:MAG: hypothetical protein MUF49_18495 [Oculatellaceae cyanobacterium Prado106]|nr:hypothetical protein [Oculatellaceae cyanobacterium Prado106]
MLRKRLFVLWMWLYLVKASTGFQLSEKYHMHDILVQPKDVIADVVKRWL